MIKNTLIASTLALLMPTSCLAALAQNPMATEWSDKPGGAVYNAPGGGKIYVASGPGMNNVMRNIESSLNSSKISQVFGGYGPQTQYHPPSFFQGAGGPVVVPPTVITTPGSISRECRRKRITIALFFEVDSSDC